MSAVIYREDGATAYFNDAGEPVEPAEATWAKQWTVVEDGSLTLQIVAVDAAAGPNG